MMEKIDKIDKKEKLFLILMGVVVFSSFSSLLVVEWLNFPLALPEVLLVPFALFFRNKFNFVDVSIQKMLHTLTYFWLLLITIGFAIGNYSPFSIVSSSRGYLYICIFFVLFSKKNSFSLDHVALVSFGSLIGWAIGSYFNLLKAIGSMEQTVSYGAALAIPLFLSTTIIKKKYKLLLLGLLLIVFISFTSGLRRQIFVSVLTLFVSSVLIVLNNPKRSFKIMALFLSLLIPFVLGLPTIEAIFKENTPRLHYRVFAQTRAVLSGEKTEGDAIRSNNFKYLVSNLDSYLYPKGFVSKQTTADKNLGIFNDFPLLELVHVFSFPVAILLISIFLFWAKKNMVRYLKFQQDESFVFTSSFIVMFSLLFIEGSFITFAYAAPFTGYCLGNLKYHSGVKLVLT